jgi:hypothetical protein
VLGGIKCWLRITQLPRAGIVAGVGGIRCWFWNTQLPRAGIVAGGRGIRGWLRNANCLQSSLSIVAGMGVDL